MLKKISVIAIALTVMGVGSLQAKEANSSNDKQQMQTTSTQASVSKSDAKKIIKKYLKSKKAYKKLRVGNIKKISGTWKVKLTANNIPVSTAYVNDKTGEITFKR